VAADPYPAGSAGPVLGPLEALQGVGSVLGLLFIGGAAAWFGRFGPAFAILSSTMLALAAIVRLRDGTRFGLLWPCMRARARHDRALHSSTATASPTSAGELASTAGSRRDDGPLPDTITDMNQAQDAYAEQLKGAGLVLCLGSMLHSIAVGNMLPSWVRIVCVDINPAVATKVSDRGTGQAVGSCEISRIAYSFEKSNRWR